MTFDRNRIGSGSLMVTIGIYFFDVISRINQSDSPVISEGSAAGTVSILVR